MSSTDNATRIGILLAVLVPLLILGWLGARSVGVAPATAQEREFIQFVKASEVAQDPKVAAALYLAQSGFYVSRGDFCLVADTVSPTPNC